MINIVPNKTKLPNEDIYPIYNYSIDFYNDVFIKGIGSINKNNVRTNFIQINE